MPTSDPTPGWGPPVQVRICDLTDDHEVQYASSFEQDGIGWMPSLVLLGALRGCNLAGVVGKIEVPARLPDPPEADVERRTFVPWPATAGEAAKLLRDIVGAPYVGSIMAEGLHDAADILAQQDGPRPIASTPTRGSGPVASGAQRGPEPPSPPSPKRCKARNEDGLRCDMERGHSFGPHVAKAADRSRVEAVWELDHRLARKVQPGSVLSGGQVFDGFTVSGRVDRDGDTRRVWPTIDGDPTPAWPWSARVPLAPKDQP